jgi:hypothetical protein
VPAPRARQVGVAHSTAEDESGVAIAGPSSEDRECSGESLVFQECLVVLGEGGALASDGPVDGRPHRVPGQARSNKASEQCKAEDAENDPSNGSGTSRDLRAMRTPMVAPELCSPRDSTPGSG